MGASPIDTITFSSIKKVVNGYLREEYVGVFITAYWCDADKGWVECL